MQIRIIILNYNGQNLLPQCLPSIVLAAAKSPFPAVVTILDNLSQDQGLRYVRTAFPQVEIYNAPANRILCSFNEYLPKITEPVVILLNNDIRVEENFLEPLVRPFEKDARVFMTAPKVISFDGKTLEAGRTEAKIRWGLFWASARFKDYEKQADTPSGTYSSGFGAFNREKFLALGGYDDLYQPGIFEDIDLSFRAGQKGWKLLYEPQSVVYHMGQASFKKKFGSQAIAILAHRNNFLFMWKNFKSFGFWIQHLLFVPLRLVFSLLKADTALLRGFIQALRHRKKIKTPHALHLLNH